MAALGLRDELELDLGLHLGDSNWISFWPPSLFGYPCWSLGSLCHSLIVVVPMEDMSSSYILETLEGEEFSRALNGTYLKKYYPSVWVDA